MNRIFLIATMVCCASLYSESANCESTDNNESVNVANVVDNNIMNNISGYYTSIGIGGLNGFKHSVTGNSSCEITFPQPQRTQLALLEAHKKSGVAYAANDLMHIKDFAQLVFDDDDVSATVDVGTAGDRVTNVAYNDGDTTAANANANPVHIVGAPDYLLIFDVNHDVIATFHDKIEIEEKLNRFIGTCNFGYGKHLGILYLGLEASLDASKPFITETSRGKVSAPCLIPSTFARLGIFVDALGALFYLKGGVSYINTKFYDKNNKRTKIMSHLAPTFGLGIEKMCSKNCVLRLDFDYKLNKTHTFDSMTAYNISIGDSDTGIYQQQAPASSQMHNRADTQITIKSRGGFTGRVMFTYKI